MPPLLDSVHHQFSIALIAQGEISPHMQAPVLKIYNCWISLKQGLTSQNKQTHTT